MTSLKKERKEQNWKEHPFLTRKGIELIKSYYPASTHIGMGRYAAYKDYGEDIWRIGYGSKKLGKRWLKSNDVATEEEVEQQVIEELKEFSDIDSQYSFNKTSNSLLSGK